MAYLLRRLVSKQKRRFQDGTFDLDLSYVTPRLIACGWPSVGREGLIRNPFGEVVRMLDHYHAGHYKVFNLCMERDYDRTKFNGPVSHLRAYDHQVPPVELLHQFVVEAEEWLDEDPRNVLVVHCKGGKGRTGIMLCALLLHQGTCRTPTEALELFARRRTLDMAGVTIGSQIRWVFYYHAVRSSGPTPWVSLPARGVTELRSVAVLGVSQRSLQGCFLVISQRQSAEQEKTALTIIQLPGSWSQVRCRLVGGSAKGPLRLCLDEQGLRLVFGEPADAAGGRRPGCMVDGDLCVELYTSRHWTLKNLMCRCWLDPRFLPATGELRLPRSHLDKVKSKLLPANVVLELSYAHTARPPAHPLDHLEAMYIPPTAHPDEDAVARPRLKATVSLSRSLPGGDAAPGGEAAHADGLAPRRRSMHFSTSGLQSFLTFRRRGRAGAAADAAAAAATDALLLHRPSAGRSPAAAADAQAGLFRMQSLAGSPFALQGRSAAALLSAAAVGPACSPFSSDDDDALFLSGTAAEAQPDSPARSDERDGGGGDDGDDEPAGFAFGWDGGRTSASSERSGALPAVADRGDSALGADSPSHEPRADRSKDAATAACGGEMPPDRVHSARDEELLPRRSCVALEPLPLPSPHAADGLDSARRHAAGPEANASPGWDQKDFVRSLLATDKEWRELKQVWKQAWWSNTDTACQACGGSGTPRPPPQPAADALAARRRRSMSFQSLDRVQNGSWQLPEAKAARQFLSRHRSLNDSPSAAASAAPA